MALRAHGIRCGSDADEPDALATEPGWALSQGASATVASMAYL
jgi:hypothetical protein